MFTVKKTAASAALLLLGAVSVVQAAEKPKCRTFREIYGDGNGGKNLCEKMWGGAFKYETDLSKAYSMFFFDDVNPNVAVTDALSAATPALFDGKGHQDATNKGDFDDDMCHLEYFHKPKPTPEPDLTVCTPWKKSACCEAKTVKDTETIMKAYGDEYHWDRCGRLSPQCEMYFLYEACFYECEPAAGLWRKHPKHVFDTDAKAQGVAAAPTSDGKAKTVIGNETIHNAWQLEKMPIKAGFCDNWYAACADDKFCAADDGDFFSCAAIYKAADDSSQGYKPHIIAAIVVPICVAVLAIVFVVVMIRKERNNEPMFSPVDSQADHSGEAA